MPDEAPPTPDPSAPPGHSAEARVFAALGKLALAASQAESYAAHGVYFLLTDSFANAANAAKVTGILRSFDALHRLLVVALAGDTPIGEILRTAEDLAAGHDPFDGQPTMVATLARIAGDHAENDGYLKQYIARNPKATPADLVRKVKGLYDKRNQCVHALELRMTEGVEGDRLRLYKRKDDGTETIIDPKSLLEHCEVLSWWDGIDLDAAISVLALELQFAAIELVHLPYRVRWFNRRQTPFDLAPLLDHYVALALRPLDEMLAEGKALASKLQAQIDDFRARQVASVDTPPEDPIDD